MMAGDWDTHPSDVDPTLDLLRLMPSAAPDGQREHVVRRWRDRADHYVAELEAEERYLQIPGGLAIGDSDGAAVAGDAFPCGCLTVFDKAAVRCLQHFRDALYYRQRIRSAGDAARTGGAWPTPPHVSPAERRAGTHAQS